jgi:hypothetical protein
MKLAESLGLAQASQSVDSAEIVVLYTGPKLTPVALDTAAQLTKGLDFHLVLLAVHIVPYPLQLRALGNIENHLAEQLQTVAAASSLPVAARIVFARDVSEAFRQAVRPESLVLIGSRKRWWRTWSDRWARDLAAQGFRTALVHV